MNFIPISAVKIGAEEEELVLEVLRSGQLAQGPMVERLESSFAELMGARHAVAMSSGTAALVASMVVADLRPGDEVVTSPFTFAATLNAILEAGAVARFVDIGDDFNIDANAIADIVNERTRVVLPVHLYGLPCDLNTIVAVAAARDLIVIEDAAQAIGATYHGVPVGNSGLGCFSLYATKNITTGEGGVVTTNSDVTADRLRLLRSQGMRARYQYEVPGRNYRLTDLQAAVGIPQLARLAEITARRRENARALSDGLRDLPGILLPTEYTDRTHVFHQFTIRVTSHAGRSRDEFASQLAAEGIATGIYYPRVVFDYPCYREHPNVITDPVPGAQRAATEVLSLPVHPGVGGSEIERIISACRRAVGR
jgi:dTDP-4-amino-4,6-dideoxygalactose transaminase